MSRIGRSEYLIQQSGCGPFQVWIVLVGFVVVNLPPAYTLMIMAFGNYNPGWRCLDDNVTSSVMMTLPNKTSSAMTSQNKTSSTVYTVSGNDAGITAWTDYDDNNTKSTTSDHVEDLCPIFDACKDVEFDQETSTVVTEWGLVCNKAWISQTVIAIQMCGMLVGSLVAGQLGDTFGRKKIIYISLAANGVLCSAITVVTYWQIFAVFMFLIGAVTASVISLSCVLSSEFLIPRWRGRMAAIPVFGISFNILAALAMLCKDWKIVFLIGSAQSFVVCLTGFWVPQSLRWLEVNNKTEMFDRVVDKIMTMNKSEISFSSNDIYHEIAHKPNALSQKTTTEVKKYTLLDIFRKDYTFWSVVVGTCSFITNAIFYGLGFGVKALDGNFYINLILFPLPEILLCTLTMNVPNILGRRKTIVSFLWISTVLLVSASGIRYWGSGNIHSVGTLILVLAVRITINISWTTTITVAAEIYPTTVRSIGVGYLYFSARVGGILAPFLIPNNPKSLYVSYLVMGCVTAACGLLCTRLPETKGMVLKETFDDDIVVDAPDNSCIGGGGDGGINNDEDGEDDNNYSTSAEIDCEKNSGCNVEFAQ